MIWQEGSSKVFLVDIPGTKVTKFTGFCQNLTKTGGFGLVQSEFSKLGSQNCQKYVKSGGFGYLQFFSLWPNF
jgi:hypothetical protein